MESKVNEGFNYVLQPAIILQVEDVPMREL